MKRLIDLLNEFHPEPTTAGQLIRAIRKNFEITQKEIEDLTGIKEPNLSAIENDRIEISLHYAQLLGAALGIHPSALLFPNGEHHKSKKIKAIEKKAAALREKKRKQTA